MSEAHSLPAASSGSSDLVVAEADYEALTEALMQTRRGRWFLTEHARRCREADHHDLCAALSRIEQALGEPREPAGLADMQEKLGALPRIEQALADYRNPPALAELRESLGALSRIEQTLAESREPAGLADMQEKLGALARIEQSLAAPREPAGIAELRAQVTTFAQTLGSVHAEVTAQRPPEPDPAERERDREREEEMLRLLHEQRERLDALADIWARVPAASTLVSASAGQVPEEVGPRIDESSAPAPVEPNPGFALAEPRIRETAAVASRADQAQLAAEQPAMLFNAQTSTADLLSGTMIFGSSTDASRQTDEAGAARFVDDHGDVEWILDVPAEMQSDEPALAADATPVVEALAEPEMSSADQAALAAAETPAPTAKTGQGVGEFVNPPAGSEAIVQPPKEIAPAHPDPIVRMFIDRELPAVFAAEAHGTGRAGAPGASPLPGQTRLPAWLVGTAADALQPAGHSEVDAGGGASDASPAAAELEATLQADVIEDLTEPAAGAHQPVGADVQTLALEPISECGPGAETEPAPLLSTDVPRADSSTTAAVIAHVALPDIAEMTLNLLKKALVADAERADASGPGADPSNLGPDNSSFIASATNSDLVAAIAALRAALGHTVQEHDGTRTSERLDDLPVRSPLPASSRAPETAASAPTDPLAPVYALSEEERIALFS